jgi:hypothetical protein
VKTAEYQRACRQANRPKIGKSSSISQPGLFTVADGILGLEIHPKNW